MAKVRIGSVGVGSMGQMAHLKNYVVNDECEVVAIAEVREKTGKLVASRYGIEKVYRDHKEMLAAEKLDGVVASQPFWAHWKLFPEIYPHTKFLFSEKPVSVTIEGGQKLAAEAKKHGCTHMVGYHKRSDPATQYAKKLLDEWKASKQYGALRYVRITMPAGDWIANGFTGMLNAGDQGPGVEWEPLTDYWTKQGWDDPYVGFVNYYIHQVNLMRHLLGESYKLTYAENSGVVLAVQSGSGVAGIIEMSPYRTTTAWEESALIAFEKAYIKLSLPAPLATHRAGDVEVYTDPGDGATPMRSMPTMPWIHAMRQQAANFIQVVKGETKPLCDAAEAVEDLKVARDYIRLRYGK